MTVAELRLFLEKEQKVLGLFVVPVSKRCSLAEMFVYRCTQVFLDGLARMVLMFLSSPL